MSFVRDGPSSRAIAKRKDLSMRPRAGGFLGAAIVVALVAMRVVATTHHAVLAESATGGACAWLAAMC
jgi:hypothetical protein